MTLNLFSAWNWKVFFEILLPNTKPIVVVIIYQPPSQSEFLEIINTHFSKLDTNNNEIYILSNFNNNLFLNNSYIFQKNNLLQGQSILSDIKKYYEFCTMFGLKQLIEVPMCVIVAVQSSLITYWQTFPIEINNKMSLVLDFLITKLYTVLEKSPCHLLP